MKNKLKVEIFDIKSMLKYNIPLALYSSTLQVQNNYYLDTQKLRKKMRK